ncbi:MAG: pyridoxamine 5'-phosphate oxidase family protein [Caldilineaceae bacterium]
MPLDQGSLSLLQSPVAQTLLESTIPAHVAYTGSDGSPRVVPIWFYWNGEEIVLGSPPTSPKVAALTKHPKVAVSIDSSDWPYRVLLIRGTATVTLVDGVVPEYAASAERYFGPEQGKAWVQQIGGMFAQMAHFHSAGVGRHPGFRATFPGAIEAAMQG